MSTIMPSFRSATVFLPLKKYIAPSISHIRAQSSSRDEGRSSDLVESSMKILKDRIDVVRKKERPCGWDYASSYIRKRKKEHGYQHTFVLICGVSSLSLLVGTALLYVFSVITHLHL